MLYTKSFFKAKARFCPKIGQQAVKLENNTYLVQMFNGNVGIRFHNTIIIEYLDETRVRLYSGGHYTRTTKERLNSYIPGRIFQHDYVWYYKDELGHQVDFEEGMEIDLGLELREAK